MTDRLRLKTSTPVLDHGAPAPSLSELLGVDESPTLAQKLRQARSLAAGLSKITDALNIAIADAELAFIGLMLGVTAEVAIGDPVSPDNPIEETISFRKEGNAWGLFYEWFDHQGDHYERTALLKASKEIRIQAADVLPRLVDAMIEKASQQQIAMANRIAVLEDLTAQLKAAK